jgi:hemoglobin/transferrin/lactoferrin receptor protein
VLQQVDGVRMPDFYSGGGPSNATTASSDSPEMDFLKRVEVLRASLQPVWLRRPGWRGQLLHPGPGRHPRPARQRRPLQGHLARRRQQPAEHPLLCRPQRDGRGPGTSPAAMAKNSTTGAKVGGTSTGREQPNPQDTRSGAPWPS